MISNDLLTLSNEDFISFLKDNYKDRRWHWSYSFLIDFFEKNIDNLKSTPRQLKIFFDALLQSFHNIHKLKKIINNDKYFNTFSHLLDTNDLELFKRFVLVEYTEKNILSF